MYTKKPIFQCAELAANVTSAIKFSAQNTQAISVRINRVQRGNLKCIALCTLCTWSGPKYEITPAADILGAISRFIRTQNANGDGDGSVIVVVVVDVAQQQQQQQQCVFCMACWEATWAWIVRMDRMQRSNWKHFLSACVRLQQQWLQFTCAHPTHTRCTRMWRIINSRT